MTAIVPDVERSVLSALWDTTRMRLLVALANEGSVSAAARAVGITQSTASEHVRVLELAARQPLVERFGRGSRLTDAGRILAARAGEALGALAAGEEEVAGLAGLRGGRIVLAASSAPGGYLLPDTLGCFREQYPGVAIELEIGSSAEAIDRVLNGGVQMAVVGAAPDDERLTAEPFAADEIVGIARPGLLPVEDGVVAPEALSQVTFLTREAGSSTQALADAELGAAGVTPGETWRLGSSDALKRAALAGLGFALVSRYAVADEVSSGRLQSFRLAGRKPLEREFVLVRLAGRQPTPAEASFVETLTTCCRKNEAYAAACIGPPR